MVVCSFCRRKFLSLLLKSLSVIGMCPWLTFLFFKLDKYNSIFLFLTEVLPVHFLVSGRHLCGVATAWLRQDLIVFPLLLTP